MKTDRKQKKKAKLQSRKECSGILWREKHVFNNSKDILRF